MRHFVLLALESPSIANLLACLYTVFQGHIPRAPMHVTVRGPYSKPANASKMAAWEDHLRREPLFIMNVGKFENGKSYVVYLEVVNPQLTKIWYKPDFPVRTFGRNPHITMYEGNDSERATAIEEFLTKEGLALRCDRFRLYDYNSKTPGLFSAQLVDQSASFQELVDLGKVEYDILERAMLAVGDTSARHFLPVHRNSYG